MTTICSYSIEQYMKMIEDFHGSSAPGLLIGGFMVDLALKNKPECEFYDCICETATCLPDAIQLLTPCTFGNGWLKVINAGRFALTVFDKYNGNGVRVNLSVSKLENFPEIKNWFLKLKKKQEQDKDLLFREIIAAGASILDIKEVKVSPDFIGKKKGSKISLCSQCGEAYPVRERDNGKCLIRDGLNLYL